jgi:hypothetical protein
VEDHLQVRSKPCLANQKAKKIGLKESESGSSELAGERKLSRLASSEGNVWEGGWMAFEAEFSEFGIGVQSQKRSSSTSPLSKQWIVELNSTN